MKQILNQTDFSRFTTGNNGCSIPIQLTLLNNRQIDKCLIKDKGFEENYGMFKKLFKADSLRNPFSFFSM